MGLIACRGEPAEQAADSFRFLANGRMLDRPAQLGEFDQSNSRPGAGQAMGALGKRHQIVSAFEQPHAPLEQTRHEVFHHLSDRIGASVVDQLFQQPLIELTILDRRRLRQ